MKLRLVVTWLLVASVLLAGCVAVPVPQGPVACNGVFEATVRQGENAGLSLMGDLAYTIDALGSINGTLTQQDGSSVDFVGQANGRAINLAFTVGEGQYIFGVGTGTDPITDCGGAMGGPFVGPAAGDSGDWLFDTHPHSNTSHSAPC